MGQILRKNTFGHLYPEFAKEMGGWVASGKIKYREEIVDGLETHRKPAQR